MGFPPKISVVYILGSDTTIEFECLVTDDKVD